MLNYQLEIVGYEFVTSIGHSDEFYVNLLFDRSIYRPMCTHMGYSSVTNAGLNASRTESLTLTISLTQSIRVSTVTLLLQCCDSAVTLFLQCCYTIVTVL